MEQIILQKDYVTYIVLSSVNINWNCDNRRPTYHARTRTQAHARIMYELSYYSTILQGHDTFERINRDISETKSFWPPIYSYSTFKLNCLIWLCISVWTKSSSTTIRHSEFANSECAGESAQHRTDSHEHSLFSYVILSNLLYLHKWLNEPSIIRHHRRSKEDQVISSILISRYSIQNMSNSIFPRRSRLLTYFATSSETRYRTRITSAINA